MSNSDYPFLAGLDDETRNSGNWSISKEESEFIREYFKSIRKRLKEAK